MSNPIYKGTVTKTESPGSGAIRNGSVVTLKYRGTLASLTAADGGLPSKGGNLTVGGTRYVVTDVTITPGKGGLAEGVVTIKPSTPGSGQGASAIDATFEVEMAQLEKSILSHPRYKDVADIVRKWMDSPAKFRNADQYEDEDGNGVDVTDDVALECIGKIRKGVESYLVFSPVVIKTSYPASLPDDIGANCGKRESPDVAESSAGAWLKTADRATESQGGVTRVEQWTGADEWDEDLYEEAT